VIAIVKKRVNPMSGWLNWGVGLAAQGDCEQNRSDADLVSVETSQADVHECRLIDERPIVQGGVKNLQATPFARDSRPSRVASGSLSASATATYQAS
jgi:hypothetical protein